MLRKMIRVLASLFLLGSVALGIRVTYLWWTPSDEQEIYDKKFQEAVEKVKRAEAARGTSAGAKLGQEAKEAIAVANIWRGAASDRLRWNRLGVIANAGVAFFSLMILVLTFTRRKPPLAVAQPHAWSDYDQNPNYGGQPGFDNQRLPGH